MKNVFESFNNFFVRYLRFIFFFFLVIYFESVLIISSFMPLWIPPVLIQTPLRQVLDYRCLYRACPTVKITVGFNDMIPAWTHFKVNTSSFNSGFSPRARLQVLTQNLFHLKNSCQFHIDLNPRMVL